MLTKDDLRQGLNRLGLKPRMKVIVHSSLSSFGNLEGGAETVISVLQELVTHEGLLVMPTFTYGKETFSLKGTPSKTGYITEVFRRQSNVYRSQHPTHSICAWGKEAINFVLGHLTESAFGKDSPFYKLFQDNGSVLLIGTDYNSCSLIHMAQELANVAYLNRAKTVEVMGSDKLFLVRRAGCSLGFNKIEAHLDYNNISKVQIGKSRIMLIAAKTIVDTAIQMLLEDQESLCCNSITCFSCNEARKMIKASYQELR